MSLDHVITSLGWLNNIKASMAWKPFMASAAATCKASTKERQKQSTATSTPIHTTGQVCEQVQSYVQQLLTCQLMWRYKSRGEAWCICFWHYTCFSADSPKQSKKHFLIKARSICINQHKRRLGEHSSHDRIFACRVGREKSCVLKTKRGLPASALIDKV